MRPCRLRFLRAHPAALAITVGLVIAACEPRGSAPEGPQTGEAQRAASAEPPTPKPTATPAAAAPSATSDSVAARKRDQIQTDQGDIVVTPIRHATMMLEHDGLRIAIDPWSKGPIDGLLPADLILVTDIHPDHLDLPALQKLSKPDTQVVASPAAAAKIEGAKALRNGEETTVRGVKIEAVPAYNVKRGPKPGTLYHDKGRGNGYVLTWAGKRIYLSGDTACTDEMKALKDIDVAFVCMNLPYTMPPTEAAECVKAFKPKLVYPYHYRGSDLGEFEQALESTQGVEVRRLAFYP